MLPSRFDRAEMVWKALRNDRMSSVLESRGGSDSWYDREKIQCIVCYATFSRQFGVCIVVVSTTLPIRWETTFAHRIGLI